MADANSITSETWTPVVGYEGVYEVSSLGFVRRCDGFYRVMKNLRPATNHHGYLNVCLSRYSKCRTFFVHRLVCEAFIGPRPSGHTINHKNGVKTDNRLINLEYLTHSDNMAHAKNEIDAILPSRARGDRNGSRKYPERLKRGAENGNASLNEETVLSIKRMLKTGARQRDIASQFSTSQSTVWRIAADQIWRHVKDDQTNP